MSLSPPDRADVARRWLRWADEDLALAEHSAADSDVVARGACVWAHQAAEKALKALLILRDIDPPKLHDLDRLAQRLPRDEGRYPADLDEATHADAAKAIAVAREVLGVVRRRVTPAVRP